MTHIIIIAIIVIVLELALGIAIGKWIAYGMGSNDDSDE